MASSKWYKDNPKVLSYLPRRVHTRLREFTTEHEVSVSKALAFILEEYFGLESEPSNSLEATRQAAKIKNLSQEVEDLKMKVTELNSQLSKNQPDVTEPTQSSKSAHRGESPNPLDSQRYKIRREVTEPFGQTTSSDKTKDEPQARGSMFDYSPKNAQDSPITEEENIPISKTTPMRNRLRTSGKNDQIERSRKQSSSPNQSDALKEQGSSDHSPQSSSKQLLGRLDSFLQKRLGGSPKDSSSAPRPALPPPSDP